MPQVLGTTLDGQGLWGREVKLCGKKRLGKGREGTRAVGPRRKAGEGGGLRGWAGAHLVSAAQKRVVFVVVQRVVEGVVPRLLQLHLELLQTEEHMLYALGSTTPPRVVPPSQQSYLGPHNASLELAECLPVIGLPCRPQPHSPLFGGAFSSLLHLQLWERVQGILWEARGSVATSLDLHLHLNPALRSLHRVDLTVPQDNLRRPAGISCPL